MDHIQLLVVYKQSVIELVIDAITHTRVGLHNENGEKFVLQFVIVWRV